MSLYEGLLEAAHALGEQAAGRAPVRDLAKRAGRS
jgi:hypothetical protein